MSNHSLSSPTPVLQTLGGRFRLRRVVGHEPGIGATIYLAQDLQSRCKVLAVLSDNEQSSDNVDSLRSWVPVLRHPGLVDVLGVNEPGERPYLVLGMPEGVPMGRIVARYGRYDAATFANIGAQLLSTVGYLHDRGLVHGDLHIDNIYINGDDPRTAKVTVAGAHRCSRTDRPTSVDDLEQTRLAPLPQERPLDPRDDVFTLGVLLESVLELTPDTFDGSDLLLVRLRALCNRCKSSTRSRRPANAGELLGAFSDCFGRPPTDVEPPALLDTPTRVLSTGTVHASLQSPPSVGSQPRPAPRPVALTVPAPPPPLRPAAATIPMSSPVVASATALATPAPPMAMPAMPATPAMPNPPPVSHSEASTVPPVAMGLPSQLPTMPPAGHSGSSRLGRLFGVTAATIVSTSVLLMWPRPERASAEVPAAVESPAEAAAQTPVAAVGAGLPTAPGTPPAAAAAAPTTATGSAPVPTTVAVAPATTLTPATGVTTVSAPPTVPPATGVTTAPNATPMPARSPEETCLETPSKALAMKEDTAGPAAALHADSEFDAQPGNERAEALWSEPTQDESDLTIEDEDEAAPTPSRTNKKKKRRKRRRRRPSSRAKTAAQASPSAHLFMGVSQ